MNSTAAFILGLLIGWLVEWVIDWVYWRRKIQTSGEEIAGLKRQVAELKANLEGEDMRAASLARASENEQLKADLEARTAEAAELKLNLEGQTREMEDLRAALDSRLSENEQLQAGLAARTAEVADLEAKLAAGAAAAAGTGFLVQGEEPVGLVELPKTEEPTTLVPEKAAVPAGIGLDEAGEHDIQYVKGIGPIFAEKLVSIGISTTGNLLQLGGTPKGRAQISKQSGIKEELILEWINHIDLCRIKGVAAEYADLLEEAGVDTVIELANRNPARLHEKLSSVNEAKKLVRQMPSLEQVQDWVEQAKLLPRAISY